MPTWLQAGLWGLVAGGALVIGAAIAWWVRVPPTIIAGIMAFGAGVLISALAFELVDQALRQAGATATRSGSSGARRLTSPPTPWSTGAEPGTASVRGGRSRREDEQSGSGAADRGSAPCSTASPSPSCSALSLLGGGGVSGPARRDVHLQRPRGAVQRGRG